MREIDLYLSTSEVNNVGQIVFREDDFDTNKITAKITENGAIKNLSGYDVYFNARVNNTIIARDLATLESDKSTVSYVVKQPFLQKLGMIKCYFSFEKNGKRESTADFNYHVIKGTCKNIKQGNYIYDFEKILEESNQFVEQYTAEWFDFFDDVKETLESVDPGGKLLLRVTNLEKEFKNTLDGTLISIPFNKSFTKLSDRLNFSEQFIYDYVPNSFNFEIKHDSEFPVELSITTYLDAIDCEVGGLEGSGRFDGGTVVEIPFHLSHDRRKVNITMPSKYYSKGTITHPVKNVFIIIEGNKATKFELKNANGVSANYA